MKIFTSQQVQELDKYTIENEPIKSTDLMERAASNVFESILSACPNKTQRFCIVVGPGNNGGDGLVVARLLHNKGFAVAVYFCDFTRNISADCKINIERFIALKNANYTPIKLANEIVIEDNDIIIDAVFGSGLSRSISGNFAEIIDLINNSQNQVFSIDIPSGLFGENNNDNNGAIIKANRTYALEFPSLVLMFPENNMYVGDIEIIKIGISERAKEIAKTNYQLITKDKIQANFRKRKRMDHKGVFGHALLIAGSSGMVGAAVLAAKACVRSGVGLVTARIPKTLSDIMQISVPELMLDTDEKSKDLEKYNAIGIGPGIGTDLGGSKLLLQLLANNDKPIVIDADALNILAKEKGFLELLNPNTILTPHPKEFERLFGKFNNSYDKIMLMQKISRKYGIVIVLKGGYTCISTPDGQVYFNIYGNPGMATGGSGDVLTGIILALLAQNYTSSLSAIIGVHIHAIAGDIAKSTLGETSLVASDIISNLGEAFVIYE